MERLGCVGGANEHTKQSNIKSIRLFGKEIFVATTQQEQERSVSLFAHNLFNHSSSSFYYPNFLNKGFAAAAEQREAPKPAAAQQQPQPPRSRKPMTRPTAEETKRARIHPPALPLNFKGKITLLGGTDPMLVIQKYVYKTDVNTYEGRLSLPKNQIRANFLTREEKVMIEQTVSINRSKREGLNVKVIDMWMTEHEMILKKWGERKNKNGETCWSYALISRWNEVAESNGLVKGDVIQLWSFRFEGKKLGLALVKLDEDMAKVVDADAEEDDSSNSESEGSCN
ncbi:hypothetical protein Dimus_008235 [Dionaea muscipula]